MGELFNSAIAKALLAIALTAGSALASHFVTAAGKVPQARVEAVREQRSEMALLLGIMAEHCTLPPREVPDLSNSTVKRLPDNVQRQLLPVDGD